MGTAEFITGQSEVWVAPQDFLLASYLKGDGIVGDCPFKSVESGAASR